MSEELNNLVRQCRNENMSDEKIINFFTETMMKNLREVDLVKPNLSKNETLNIWHKTYTDMVKKAIEEVDEERESLEFRVGDFKILLKLPNAKELEQKRERPLKVFVIGYKAIISSENRRIVFQRWGGFYCKATGKYEDAVQFKDTSRQVYYSEQEAKEDLSKAQKSLSNDALRHYGIAVIKKAKYFSKDNFIDF